MKAFLTGVLLAAIGIGGLGWYSNLTVKQGGAALAERVGISLPGLTDDSASMEAPDPAAMEAEVLEADAARRAAVGAGDGEAWGQYIGDDCVWTNAAGVISSNKAERVAAITERGAREDTSTISEQEVHVYGDSAVVTNLLSVPNADDDTTTTTRFTRTYVKQDGQWRMVALHSSIVADVEEE